MRKNLMLQGTFRPAALAAYRQSQDAAAPESRPPTFWPRSRVWALAFSLALVAGAVVAPVKHTTRGRVRIAAAGRLEVVLEEPIPAPSIGVAVDAQGASLTCS